ncbi:hypothetical protein GOP47_0010025 [Adiantum capillus-veneris]|uniref:Uncharacterized protein n=1 Tax=Adiantum capillus-veneris TaxID=13818 RepID=A0A9D4UXQ3_ADICA|nr:hypothetical protein GOP47_0010025 [Adiantum capillus-veneris]
MRPQQLQRGVYQVTSDVLDQVTSEKQAVEKIAEVPNSVSFVEKAELCSSYSSALDADNTWETESAFSRYETYDVMYVDNLVKEQQVAGEEPVFKDQGVGKPSLLPCDSKAMLTEEECIDEVDWGFNDPVIDVDDESQILVAKAMARIQDMRGCVSAPVLLEEPTDEVALLKDNDAMEISLDNGWETQDAEDMLGVHVCFGREDGSCIQPFEQWCYEGLHDWLADKDTGAK